MADEPQSVGDILDRLDQLADEKDQVALGDMIEAFGHRAYGPFLIVLPLIELSPVGGIPGVPTVLAAIIVLLAAQMLFGRKHMWLPGWLRRRSVKAKRMHKAVAKVRPVGERMDRWFHGRLESLTSGPAVRVAAAASILLAATVPPLELLPFASSAPMLAIAAFGVALLVRDGVLMIVASLLATAALGIGIGLLGSGAGQGS
ncbi:exopolysaccharide biosynthesis protein [Sphingomonas jatrophae]|uniref:Uncharacterized conserved protein n=1 Tax=Sphingomonas jatrophae TaxID=1166337 RepID=A0A1I6M5W8_9SPHN|nr:exopolysaccharide biosynthesis protein [Sphingomonas jatrophae]SFS11079.1 Uncharacterized conserved protein [Sphingomonas jatrophae]